MEWLKGDLADAVKLAAAKSLLVREKRAVGELSEAESGRRTLGYLGVPEGRVNDLASRYRSGDISRTGAMAQYHAAAPLGIPGQIANLPSSVSTAAGQGDIGGALAQADVVGLKNLNPIENPLTAGTAGMLGAAGYGVGRHMQNNADIKKLLAGSYSADKDPLMDSLKGNDTAINEVKAHRETMPSKADELKRVGNRVRQGAGNVRGAYSTGGVKGVGKALKTELGAAASGIKSHVAGPALPPSVTRGRMESLLTAQRTKGGPGIRKPLMAGAALASIPLLAREWLHPTGYRSGHNPFSKVLDANEPK